MDETLQLNKIQFPDPITFDIISEEYDQDGFCGIKFSNGDEGINIQSVCDGSRLLTEKDTQYAKRFFERATRTNNLPLLKKLLDFFVAPDYLSFKEKLVWYKLFNKEEKG